MAGRAKGVHMSLYPEQIQVIQKHREEKKLTSDAAALQHIIDFFKINYRKTFLKNILTFVGFPALIGVFLFLISNALFNIHQTMIEKGIILEYPEVTLSVYQLGVILQVGQLGATAFIVVSMLLFIVKTRKQG